MKIVFVCTGNTCRSPMAEGFLKSILQKNGDNDTLVVSRGIFAQISSGASQNSCIAAKELGADISQHKAMQLTKEDIESADYIFTMTKAHKDAICHSFDKYCDKVFTVSEFTSSCDISDPYGLDLETYRRCANSLFDAAQKIYNRLFGTEK